MKPLKVILPDGREEQAFYWNEDSIRMLNFTRTFSGAVSDVAIPITEDLRARIDAAIQKEESLRLTEDEVSKKV